jgi:hypothetical protein
MPQRAFHDGYLAGWQWIRGDDDAPAIPVYCASEDETPYRAGILKGIRDACASPQKSVTNCEQMKNWLGRALQREQPD